MNANVNAIYTNLKTFFATSFEGTYYHWLDSNYALVFCNDNDIIYGKVAYNNSALQCDFDFDWTMPYDEKTGEVYDTEVSITCAKDVQWLLNEYEYMKKVGIII